MWLLKKLYDASVTTGHFLLRLKWTGLLLFQYNQYDYITNSFCTNVFYHCYYNLKYNTIATARGCWLMLWSGFIFRCPNFSFDEQKRKKIEEKTMSLFLSLSSPRFSTVDRQVYPLHVLLCPFLHFIIILLYWMLHTERKLKI